MADNEEQNGAVECNCEAGAPKWVVTFGDMMSLLLCFFVLLLSFSNTDVVKYRQLVGSLKDAFGVAETNPNTVMPGGDKIIATEVSFPVNLPSLVSIRAVARQIANASGKIEAESGADWVRIKVEGDTLFDSGSAEIKPDAFPILSEIAGMINDFSGTVAIEGHTDNQRLSTDGYLGNYFLAANRSVAVLGHLTRQQQVDRVKLRAVSLADANPRETNDVPEGRAKNRRVEFLFTGGSKGNLPGQTVTPG